MEVRQAVTRARILDQAPVMEVLDIRQVQAQLAMEVHLVDVQARLAMEVPRVDI